MQQGTAPDATIEDRLEEAIFKAGGILASNRGQLSKVGWSRSSRTDKSVHSLSTVIGMKMEVPVEAFDADPEGQELAAVVNSHLPPEVRVFSIQRVSKSWNARSECIRRTYNYWLPASALGLALDGGEADAARMALLRAAWERFQGTHPFHNYTKRRLYREPAGRDRANRRGVTRADRDRLAAETEGEEADEVEEEAAADQPGGSGSGSSSSTGGGGSSAGGGGSGGAGSATTGAASSGGVDGGGIGVDGSSEAAPVERGRVQLAWKHEKDGADLVTKRHFRYMEWCRADTEVKPLVPGGQPCVQLSLTGGNFMLHQIRHMVGAAVAVARGTMPLELLEASLATPARVSLPLAPPSTLMLIGAQFSPFKRSWSGQAAEAARWTGETLELKERGAAAQRSFLQQVMHPALDQMLAGEEWAQWCTDLDRLWCDPDELQEMLSTHATWRAARQEAKVQAMLEEAAALENREE
ncbi:tRNA pseudouridine synthase [Micractinium conductrix]|uniref:tRNA pseudouridine synthase n=1 Tax=Micractinium conductrix TaxID=554055 RepID=A0A2P6VG62_9CHLO|nr:tRNA pseudouridine synthase [Micractinium conductrix]|eukprot:PSC73076.1 tRNA pseudouridine synthase [Micractinium conductrix]